MKPKPAEEQTVISVRVAKSTKEAAQEVAAEMGIPLSTLINAYLMKFIVERRVEFIAPPEKMTPHLEKLLKKIEKEKRQGKVSKVYTDVDEFFADLHE